MDAHPWSLIQWHLWCLFGSFTHVSVLPGITHTSVEHSNITVPAEISEHLSSSAKANMLFVLMRCYYSFTSALLQYCIPQAGVLGEQRKKDGFSRGYGSFQIGFWMSRCYVSRNVTCWYPCLPLWIPLLRMFLNILCMFTIKARDALKNQKYDLLVWFVQWSKWT